ncbi:MAG: manganese-dependent inorganic pyrophosphatase [Patescibacteria group bacterium]|jgi:manganese-dependent inorganic pyrophosphatase
MPEKIYVLGHKSPDLDSVAAAISYAHYKNKTEETDVYLPRVAGGLNRETEYILGKFGFDAPEIMESAKGENVILVDHNELSQAADGMDEAKIAEVLDHHKIDFKYAEPMRFETYPWGSTCTIVANKMFMSGLEISKNIAALQLAAILVDTVITKSPTTTDMDRDIIEKLSELSGISDWKRFGLEIFKIRSSAKELGAEEIIKYDFKDFNFKTGKFGVGQVETVDLNDFSGREDELLAKLKEIREAGGYHSVILFITDIMKEGSLFLVATSDREKVEAALGGKLQDDRVYLNGVISRKKQVAPKFMEVFDR